MITIASRRLWELRILLVDDDLDWRDSFAAILRSQGANVTASRSVAEARQQLQRYSFDMLLTDVHMPGEDGRALIGALRPHGIGPTRLRAVAMSSCDDASLRHGLLRSGFDAFIPKSTAMSSILCALNDLASSAQVAG